MSTSQHLVDAIPGSTPLMDDLPDLSVDTVGTPAFDGASVIPGTLPVAPVGSPYGGQLPDLLDPGVSDQGPGPFDGADLPTDLPDTWADTEPLEASGGDTVPVGEGLDEEPIAISEDDPVQSDSTGHSPESDSVGPDASDTQALIDQAGQFFSTLRARHQAAQAVVDASSEDLADAQATVDSAEAEHATALAALAAAHSELETAQANLAHAETGLAEAEEFLSAAKEDVHRIQSGTEAAIADLDRVRQAAQDAHSQLAGILEVPGEPQ